MSRLISKTGFTLLLTGIFLLPFSLCCAAPMATFSKNQTDLSKCCTAKRPSQEHPNSTKAPVNSLCCIGQVFPASQKTNVIPPQLSLSTIESRWKAAPLVSGLFVYAKSPSLHSQPLHALLCVWICWFPDIASRNFQTQISFKGPINPLTSEKYHVYKLNHRDSLINWDGAGCYDWLSIRQPELLPS